MLLGLFLLIDYHGIFILLALKKSQKDASILAQKSSKEKETYHGQGNSSSSKLELDLCGQWMSLFRHMEDTFAHEGNQLVSTDLLYLYGLFPIRNVHLPLNFDLFKYPVYERMKLL